MPTLHAFRVLTFCRADSRLRPLDRFVGGGAEAESPAAEERTSVQRTGFLKSSVALPVAAKLRTGKARQAV
jgi:hypothetical protein